jgi:hypothetical protein
MNNEEYRTNCTTTDVPTYEPIHKRLEYTPTVMILHALMGITTECGELMDQLKKHLIYGKSLDYVNIMEEDGDLRWYLSLLETACNYTADKAQDRNIEKLRARFPNRFNEIDALSRNLEKERQILEGNND